MKIRKFLSNTLLKGLSIVVPIAVAIYVMVWFVFGTENAVRSLITFALPEELYLPGMGLALVLLVVLLTGMLMYPWITRKLMQLGDKLLRRIPLFGSVYSPVKDLMDLFGGGLGEQLGAPVMIRVPNTDMETLGFVTRRDGSGLPDGMIPDGHTVVYVQWSSQVGGYCFIVPDDSLRSVDMTVEEAMRWSLTAGLSAPKRDSEQNQTSDHPTAQTAQSRPTRKHPSHCGRNE